MSNTIQFRKNCLSLSLYTDLKNKHVNKPNKKVEKWIKYLFDNKHKNIPSDLVNWTKNFEPTKKIFYSDMKLKNKNLLFDLPTNVNLSRFIQQCNFDWKGQIIFLENDMIEFASKLSKQYKNNQISLLNMANNFEPGGGFFSGAKAQEEILCYRANNLIYRLVLQSDLYPIGNGNCLITPDVKIYYDSKNNFVKSKKLNILSAAAQNLSGSVISNKLENNYDLFYKLTKLWLSILYGGAVSGSNILIVSAIGCGAFNNPPEIVTLSFFNALRNCNTTWLNKINIIYFVVLNDFRSKHNVERIKKTLKKFKSKIDISFC